MLKGWWQIQTLHNEFELMLYLKKTKPERSRLFYEQQNKSIPVCLCCFWLLPFMPVPHVSAVVSPLSRGLWLTWSWSFPADCGHMEGALSELVQQFGVRALRYLCFPFIHLRIFREAVGSEFPQGLRSVCTARSSWGMGTDSALRRGGFRGTWWISRAHREIIEKVEPGFSWCCLVGW